jgi:hypothetical protein
MKVDKFKISLLLVNWFLLNKLAVERRWFWIVLNLELNLEIISSFDSVSIAKYGSKIFWKYFNDFRWNDVNFWEIIWGICDKSWRNGTDVVF